MRGCRHHIAARAGAIALPIVLLSACQPKLLPTAASELATGIIVYEDPDFRGESALIMEDISDLRDFTGPCWHSVNSGVTVSVIYDWNDCISSIRVAPGWRATIYRDPGYQDDSIDITVDVAHLELAPHNCPNRGLNDCVSSVRVRRE